MPSSSSRSLVLLGPVAAAALLAACSSSSAAGPAPARASGTTSPAAAAVGGSRGPAASGKIAAITGSTMQVQNQQTGQVAVTWTAKTAFSHQVAVPSSGIAVGTCVMAFGGSSGSAGAAFTATRIVLTTAVAGSCTGGFGGGADGGRPSGRPGDRPTGPRPTGGAFPSGARRTGFGEVAFGAVTAKSGATLTVTSQRRGSTTPVTRLVTVGSATKVYRQAATTATSLAVGLCVTAQGPADSSGTVTATRVQISDAVGGSCTTGFGQP